MKKFFLVIIVSLMSLQAWGQTEIREILGLIENSRVSLTYSCNVKMDVQMKSSGNLMVQKNCYKLSTAGVDIYCDGENRWTVDSTAKEVYIEPTMGAKEFLSNQELYLGKLSDVVITDTVIEPASDDIDCFRFDTSALDSSWVVTDLR